MVNRGRAGGDKGCDSENVARKTIRGWSRYDADNGPRVTIVGGQDETTEEESSSMRSSQKSDPARERVRQDNERFNKVSRTSGEEEGTRMRTNLPFQEAQRENAGVAPVTAGTATSQRQNATDDKGESGVLRKAV